MGTWRDVYRGFDRPYEYSELAFATMKIRLPRSYGARRVAAGRTMTTTSVHHPLATISSSSSSSRSCNRPPIDNNRPAANEREVTFVPAGFRFGIAYIHGRRYETLSFLLFPLFSLAPPLSLSSFLPVPFFPPLSLLLSFAFYRMVISSVASFNARF